MKYEFIKVKSDGVVSGINEVHFAITYEEACRLRESLAILDKYKKVARSAYKTKYKYDPIIDADWCEFDFAVKNDRLILSITNGSAG